MPLPTPQHSEHFMEGMSGASGVALGKFFLSSTGAAVIAACIGFLFVPPKTVKETLVRLIATLLCSFTFGPITVIAVHAYFPSLFASANALGLANGLGVMYISWPLVVIAGLPAWWIMGWAYRWLERHKDKDASEMLAEIRRNMRIIKDVEDKKHTELSTIIEDTTAKVENLENKGQP